MSWRDRVLQTHADEVAQWWRTVRNEPIPDEDEFESVDRANYLDALRQYDAQAQLAEELHIRLEGLRAQGALDFELGRRLFKPLQNGISAAAETDVHMELVGILPGSTVLVARPQHATDTDEGSMHPADTSSADEGAREWLRMLSAAETEGDLRAWARAFPALGDLVRVLDDGQLDLGLVWFAPSGTRRRARLTQRGRSYVNRLREQEMEAHQRVVGGTVTELRASGHVKVKTGARKGATAYDVRFDDPDALMELHLELGATAWFMVREETTTDQLGAVVETKYTFIRVASRQDELPDPGSEGDVQ